jgi:hypothetical protein
VTSRSTRSSCSRWGTWPHDSINTTLDAPRERRAMRLGCCGEPYSSRSP